jgi:hypothetical protein
MQSRALPSGDVIVSTNESWPAGEYHLTSLTVLNGATLTLQGANNSAQVGGQWAGYGATIYAASARRSQHSVVRAGRASR